MYQVRYLGAIGGKDANETTRRIMRSLMTNSVAERVNFVGRGGKKAIKEMKLLQAIIGIHLISAINVFDYSSKLHNLPRSNK